MVDGAKAAELAALRQKLARIERGSRPEAAVLPFGVPVLDAALPGGGLLRGALHEVGGLGAAAEEGAEAALFLAGILARLEPARPVLWCLARADLYAPGLACHGLLPERLILARSADEREILWAMEEGLKCPALAAVIGEVEVLPGIPGRRLQLAAEASGITVFALRRRFVSAPSGAETQPTAAVTCWRVAALPGRSEDEPGIGRPLWRLELLRCRGGQPGQWVVEAGDATGHVHGIDELADRPPAGELARTRAG